MIKELKTVVILDNIIINVGEWDYQEGKNLLPTGARIEEKEMFFTDEHGWREVGWTPPLSQDEKLAQLEQEKEQLAQTLDRVLTDLIPSLLTTGE